MNDTDTTNPDTHPGTTETTAGTGTHTIATTDLEFDRTRDTPSSTGPSYGSDGSPFVCSRCSRPFAHEEWLELHRGVAHDDLTTDEHAAFIDAYETEEDELRLFRLKALIALIAIYFGFIMSYSIFA